MTSTEQLVVPLGAATKLATETPSKSAPKASSAHPARTHFMVMALLLVLGSWIAFTQSPQIAAGLAVAASGAAALLGIVGTRRLYQRNAAQQLATRAAEWELLESRLRTQLTEQTRREQQLITDHTRLREELAAISNSTARLTEELNQRKAAEKTLSQKQFDLTRTKGVLELHVQAGAEELQKLQRRHEMILDSAGEGICGWNNEGRVTFANPAAARILGGSVEKILNRPLKEIFPGLPATPPADAKGESNGRPAELALNRLDGSSHVLEYSRSPIREGGRPVGEVLTFKDITERKQTEEALAHKATELQRSNAELEQFAFVASHDLQEPLRKILAFGDRLKVRCEAVDLGDAKQYLERMQNAAARMRTLIDDLLTFSRVISRTEPFDQVELKTVAREVLTDLEVRIEKSGAQVELGELPTLEANPMQMRQLLQNLIGNALKFHEPGAKPVVKIAGRIVDAAVEKSQTAMLRRRATGADKLTEQFCEVTVQDNGIGFEEKYLDRIFAVFQRLHGKQEFEGTGIGLAVCRRIVDRHCGTITAKSKPGEGATFIVTLPVQAPHKPAAAAATPPAAPATA